MLQSYFMPTVQYTLCQSTQLWKNALLSIAHLLPADVYPDNNQYLNLLPIFALIIVIDNEVLTKHTDGNLPDNLLQSWINEQCYWQMVAVKDTPDYCVDISAKQEASAISDVSVFRYLLMPVNSQDIHADTTNAAVHILDEQLTSYLRKKLMPKPTYNYAVDSTGQVANFQLGAITKRDYLDCHILPLAQILRQHKLACFDMDATLIKQEVMVELAKMAGVGEQVNEITESAMRGEIDFAKSFALRIKLLQGLDANKINEIKSLLMPNQGAFITIAALKRLGFHTALISGGFEPFAQYVADLLGIDEYHANPLHMQNNKITGEIIAPILDGKQKAKIVAKIANNLSIDLQEVICIGDGANDLPMMAISDLGLAYKAKPIVQVKADASINLTGLEGVLYALGHSALRTK